MSSFYPSSLPPPHPKKKTLSQCSLNLCYCQGCFPCILLHLEGAKGLSYIVHFWWHTNHIETGEKGRLHAVSTGICEFWQTKKTGRPKWKATTFLYVDCSPLYSQTIIVLNFPWKKISIRSARKSWAFGWEGGKFTTIDCTNGYQGNLGNLYGINLFCVYIATIFE